MNQIFADRFKSARILNGLSLQDLADQLGNRISRQALHKYEKGEVIPDGAMIRLLSAALKVSADYFFNTRRVELGEVEFRKLNRLPAKDEHRIIEAVRDQLSRYLELEDILGIKTRFSSPVTQTKTISSLEDVEIAATQVRIAWEIGAGMVANTLELLEDQHIKVVEVSAGDSFDGMQAWVDSDIPVIAINRDKVISADRKRFTAMHELGHLLLPLQGLSEAEKEKYCHQFAAAILLPKEAAFRELGIARSKLMIPELGALKRQYGISMQAIVMRAKDLKILSDHYTKQFFFMVRQMGWKTSEPIEYIGEDSSLLFRQLVYRALAEELITVSKAASLCNMSLQDFRAEAMALV